MNPTGKNLYIIDSHNPKTVIIDGLKKVIEDIGDLKVPFDFTTDYPSTETFKGMEEDDKTQLRRIVVRKLNNTVNNYAIGNQVREEIDLTSDNPYSQETLGWVDKFLMEISIWSTDSKDRDNIVELIKLWFLELEQDVASGTVELPFLFSREIFAVRFIQEYEDQNDSIYRNGPVYVGSVVIEMLAPFFHKTVAEDYKKYKTNVLARIRDFC